MDSLVRITGLLALSYCALLIWVYFSQQGMLYFPEQFRPTPKQAQTERIQLWPGPGDQYRGLLITPDQPTATAIVFHGNAGTAWDRRFYADALSKLNYRVILAEYPGYGGRTGPINEQMIINDARSTIALARKQFSGPVSLWGESLGAAVAAGSAASEEVSLVNNPEPDITGVVLITPWYSLPELAQSLYWYLPARWLTREQYNNELSLTAFQGRTAVLVADQDEIIPNQQSLQLYHALQTNKQLWVFERASHNNWPAHPDADWWAEVDRFIRQQ